LDSAQSFLLMLTVYHNWMMIMFFSMPV
jgi:hypothetical protein